MILTRGCKLVFIGDSISDAGRKPDGEGLFDALGKGYIARVDALLQATYPQLKIRVVNKASSGHTVRELAGRWESDVLKLKPDFVAVMIGTNDVWRQFDTPFQPEWAVFADEYEPTLDKLCAQTVGKVKKLILLTPYYLEPNKKDAMRAQMDRYGAIVKKLAKKHGAIFVDTQAAMDKFLKHQHANALAWDRVHPNETGHMILARAFLDAVGYAWEG